MVSNFSTKANFFNNFFTAQCSPVLNSSTLSSFSYKTEKRISNFDKTEDDIPLIFKNLNPTKSHGWDNIPIRIIQLSGKSIVKPLKYLFESFLTAGIIFPEDCIISVHKKESKNCLKNYGPINLLPIFSKISGRLIFNDILNFFVQNRLLTDFQSGFISGDFCGS